MVAKYQLITELYQRTGAAVSAESAGVAELFVLCLPKL